MFQRLGIAAVAMTFVLLVTPEVAAATRPADTTGAAGTDTAPGTAPDTAAAQAQRAAAPPVLDVAHRGGSAYAPENTLAAIDAAHEHEATAVEIDVQRSKDDELVVVHDTTLARTTDVEQVFPNRSPYNVADFTLAELRRLDAGSWFGSEFAGERVPTLQEALDRLDEHKAGLFLEIKSPALYPGIEDDIAQTLKADPGWVAGNRAGGQRLVIQSFDRASAERSHELLPSVPHGILGRVAESEIAAYAEWADMINPNHTGIDAAYVERVHDAGMDVVAYTINEPDDMRAAIGKGVDGIISDYPDVARQVIQEETGLPPGGSGARPFTADALADLTGIAGIADTVALPRF
ncbi:glycerophosphodiester phosphodiesterase [Nocardiopsis mangrovi]|uniref:Glycerophosphodiester phosphodiesterase n=1 Tax=Nocardiopsis mangrovi TaxID=1179818 RepID=A0ABV9DRN9_9ACTN